MTSDNNGNYFLKEYVFNNNIEYFELSTDVKRNIFKHSGKINNNVCKKS